MAPRKPAPPGGAHARRTSRAASGKGRPGGALVSTKSSNASTKEDEAETGGDESEVLVAEVVGQDHEALHNERLDLDPDGEDALLLDDPLSAIDKPSQDLETRPSPLAPLRDPLQRFLSEARSYRRLTEAEERELVAAARGQGDVGAARRLVVHNLRLVVTIAYQYRRAWTNILDLFQEGSVGLMEAVRRWDPELGTRFGTYAAYWIRAYILKFLMTNARLIHVGNTRAGRKLFFRLEKERSKLLAAGFDVTPKLLASKLDVDEKDVLEVSAHLASREVSFEPRPDDDGVSLAERISSPQDESPERQASRSLLADQVRQAMDGFAAGLEDEREQAVWAEHLAAQDDPVPLSDLGARYGVSKQRMGQIADRLKKRFREALIAQMGPEIQMSWQPGQDD